MNIGAVKNSALNAYNSYRKNDYDNFIKHMDKFYNIGKTNPSVADIILGDTIRSGYFDAIEANKKELKNLDNLPMPQSLISKNAYLEAYNNLSVLGLVNLSNAFKAFDLVDEFSLKLLPTRGEYDRSFNEKYPNSGKYRKELTKIGAISLDKTNPKQSWYSKIIRSDLRKFAQAYPKTLLLRTQNFLNHRIVEDKVTPKLKFIPRLITKYNLHKMGIKLK